MAATKAADRQHSGFTFAKAGAITPAADDLLLLGDASNSNANSKASITDTVRELDKSRLRYQRRYFTDFWQQTSTADDDNRWSLTQSGTGTTSVTVVANDIQGRMGQIQLTTGTTATGTQQISAHTAPIRLGGAKWFYEGAVSVANLSTTQQRYQLFMGFITGSHTDFVCLAYDQGGIVLSTAATYWQTVTRSNSTTTLNSNHTQITVNAATYYRLGVEVNADASEAKFYVDGTLVGTHTTNIPSGSGRFINVGARFVKSNGTTARTANLDYLLACADFTTAR